MIAGFDNRNYMGVLAIVADQEETMVIKMAEVRTRGEQDRGVVSLTLTEERDGWTYRVDGMQDHHFTLTWRSKTREGASRKLRDAYDPKIWDLTVKETG